MIITPHMCQRIQHTQKVGTFVEQMSDFSCVFVNLYQLRGKGSYWIG